MHRIVALVLLAAGVLALTGCASSEPEDPNRVSTIPWNRPERWESQGPLGGMMNPEGGY
jgi:hypothetical protein